MGERGVLAAHFAQAEAGGRMRAALARRARHCDVPTGELVLAVVRARVVFSTLPDFVGVQLTRIWCSTWPTTKRFGEAADSCRWGCFVVGGDELAHYLACPAMLEALRATPALRPPM